MIRACVWAASLAALAGPSAWAGAPKGKGDDRPQEGSLKVGDAAPTFKLKTLDGKAEVQLAAFKGKKPVVLVFGSYT